jgi:outer membrane protein TolC
MLLLRHRAAFPPCFCFLAALLIAPLYAQDKPEAPRPQSQPDAVPDASRQASSATQPVAISLAEAIRLARANSTVFNAALSEAKAAHEDRTQARDALLPQVSYSNQYLYTQAN